MNLEEIDDMILTPSGLDVRPTVRLMVQYREVGPGVDNLELTWEVAVPTMAGLVEVLRAVLRREADDGDV